MGGDVPKRGEVWLVPWRMPSKDGARSKPRPAIIVSAPDYRKTGGVVVTVAVSSSTHRLTEFDIPVEAKTRLAKAMGLDRDCAIFCEIIQSFSAAEMIARIGETNAKTMAKIEERLSRLLGL